MSKNLWIGLVVIVVIILAGWYLARPKDNLTPTPSVESTPSTETASPSASSSAVIDENVVTISSSGFSPNDITIKVGGSVTWMNSSSDMQNVSSDPHPTHTNYSPLNLGNIPADGKVSLVFPKAGTYTYHDHLHPSFKGSITVQ